MAACVRGKNRPCNFLSPLSLHYGTHVSSKHPHLDQNTFHMYTHVHTDTYEGCRLRDRSEQKQNRQKMWVKKGIFAMTSVHEIALEVRINDPSSLGVKVFSVFLDVEHTPGHERSLKRRPSYSHTCKHTHTHTHLH